MSKSKTLCALAIEPCSEGVGFAVVEAGEALVDWGIKPVTGENKTAQSFGKIEALITHYNPNLIILQDMSPKDSWREERIHELQRAILKVTSIRGIEVAMVSRTQVNQLFFRRDEGTKHDRATFLAKRFPEELGARLPPKRRLWTSETYRMHIFEAIALAVAGCTRKKLARRPYQT